MTIDTNDRPLDQIPASGISCAGALKRNPAPKPDTAPAKNLEYTGGSVSYYSVAVEHPTTPGIAPYVAECNDVIEALGLNYAEGNALKAIWRIAAARQGKMKRGYTDGVYDAEKVVFFGERMLVAERAK